MGTKAANSPDHITTETVIVSIQPSVSVTCSSVGYGLAILVVTGIVCMKVMRILPESLSSVLILLTVTN